MDGEKVQDLHLLVLASDLSNDPDKVMVIELVNVLSTRSTALDFFNSHCNVASDGQRSYVDE
jgi:hypothetical protein